MALNLVDAAKLSTDVLLKGIIETIVKESPILQELPFIDIEGNSLLYNRELELPTAAFYAPNASTWAESAPRFTQISAALKILGGDADVDNYLKTTRSNVQDIEAAVIELKAKAIRNAFENAFLNGDSDADANSFDGVYKTLEGTAWAANTAYALDAVVVPTVPNGFTYICTTAGTSGTAEPAWPVTLDATVADGGAVWTCRSGNNKALDANGASLTLAFLDFLMDMVTGKPDMLLMSRRSRRKIATLARASGSNLEVGTGKLGQPIELFAGVPVAISDWVKDNYAVGTSTDCSAIFALQFGEGKLSGLQNQGIQIEKIGSLETKDATRTRIKWYVSLALFSTRAAAMLTGVRD